MTGGSKKKAPVLCAGDSCQLENWLWLCDWRRELVRYREVVEDHAVGLAGSLRLIPDRGNRLVRRGQHPGVLGTAALG